MRAGAEDAARHRPSRDRIPVAHQKGRHHGARPGRQRELHVRAIGAVRGHGRRAGDGGRRHRAADDRPAQHRRRRHQGQRRGEADRGTPEGFAAQFLWQRRRRRPLQGDDRRRRVRRLRRQRRLEGLRRAGRDALRLPEDRVHAQSRAQSWRRWPLSPRCVRSRSASTRAVTTALRWSD